MCEFSLVSSTTGARSARIWWLLTQHSRTVWRPQLPWWLSSHRYSTASIESVRGSCHRLGAPTLPIPCTTSAPYSGHGVLTTQDRRRHLRREAPCKPLRSPFELGTSVSSKLRTCSAAGYAHRLPKIGQTPC